MLGPWTVIRIEAAALMNGPERGATVPSGIVGMTCWPRRAFGCGMASTRLAATMLALRGLLARLEDGDEGPHIALREHRLAPRRLTM